MQMSFSDSVFYYWSDKEWDSCDKFRSAATGVLNPRGSPDMLEWSGSDTTVCPLLHPQAAWTCSWTVYGSIHLCRKLLLRVMLTCRCLSGAARTLRRPLSTLQRTRRMVSASCNAQH